MNRAALRWYLSVKKHVNSVQDNGAPEIDGGSPLSKLPPIVIHLILKFSQPTLLKCGPHLAANRCNKVMKLRLKETEMSHLRPCSNFNDQCYVRGRGQHYNHSWP